MGDQQLQQYAAMHKDDPYILPMAIAESNSRKAMRAAKQAQEGGQPQGKVADQAIASMNAPPPQMAPQGMPPQGMPPQVGAQMAQHRLPEQQGIGALPVKNMQNMADGGIAGYADGGESQFNYSGGSNGPLMNMAGGGEPVVRMAEGGVAGYAGGGVTETLRAVLKELGISASQYLNDIGVKQTVDKLVSERAAPAAAAAPAASSAPAAAAASNSGTAYELGKTVKPYLDKAGKVIKTGALPAIGGVLAGAQGLSDISNAQGFYDDPNVSTLEKAKQAGRTAVGVAAPYVGAAVGSGFAPVVGTLAGGAAGTGLAALMGGEGEALQDWRKANPQANPQTAVPEDATGAGANKSGMTSQQMEAANAPAPAPDNKLPPAPPTARLAGPSTPAAPAAPETSAAERFRSMQKEMGAGDRTAIDDKQKLLEKSMLSGATEEQTNLEKEIAARGEYGKAKEARLAEREAGLSKEKDTLQGLTALEMAIGLFAPGPFGKVVSEAGGKALKTYGAGIASLKQAKERIDDSRDQIDEFRRNESNMTAKERRDAANNINRTQIEIQKLGVAGLEKAYGLKAAEATTVFNAATQESLTKLEMGGREKVARITAGAAGAAAANSPERLAFQGFLEQTKTKEKPQGDPAKAYEMMVASKREPMSIEQMRKTWDDPAKRMLYQQQYPNVKTFDDYLTMESGVGANNSGYRVMGSRPS